MAASDARSLADSIMSHFCGRSFQLGKSTPTALNRPHRGVGGSPILSDTTRFYPDNIYPYVLTDRQATAGAIERVFREVIAKAKPNDIVVFHFSGYTASVYDSTLHDELPYLVTYDRLDSLEQDVPRRGISTRQLSDWLDLISARNQLIITDACANGRNTAKYLERFLVAGKSLTRFTPRNRVIIAPDGLVYEDPKIGGHMSHTIKQLGASVFDLFDGQSKRGKPYLLFTSLAQQFPNEAFDIFFEQEFWSDVQYMTTDNLMSPASRGAVAEPSVPALASDEPPTHNYALVIGTDQYDGRAEWKPLNNPVFDARTVARELKTRYDFDTTLLVNPTLDQVYAALNRLYQIHYDSTSQVLVFIAGHGGYEPLNTGFLTFRDSRPAHDDPNRRTYLKHTELRDKLDGIPCRHVMVLLDACFGGTFVLGRRTTSRAPNILYEAAGRQKLISRTMPYKARKYCTSGGKEYVSDGIPGKHSPFAFQFVAALRSGGGADGVLTYAELSTYLQQTNDAPTPCLGDFGDYEPGSDFLFVGKR